MIFVDVWFVFIDAFLHLICLLPFLLIQLLDLSSHCWPPNNTMAFLSTNWVGRAYSTMLTYLARLWILFIVFFFCTEWDHGSAFWGVCCHFASHACMLVASRCLADPLYAPLCSFVDMAPPSVGHCQFCISAEVRFVQFKCWLRQINASNRKAVGFRCLEMLRSGCAAETVG